MFRAGFLVFGAYTGLCTVIGWGLAEYTLHVPRSRATTDDLRALQASVREAGGEAQAVRLTADDGAKLRALWFRPRVARAAPVLLVHGQAYHAAGMGVYVPFLVRAGHPVLAPDLRAHGESGGTEATYGRREVPDLRRWVDWLRGRGQRGCVLGLGESMGGAILLQALASEPRLCAVAAECSFSALREIAYDRAGQLFGVGHWAGRWALRPAMELGLLYSHWRYGADLAEASPEAALPASAAPVLLIHGDRDFNVPLRHAFRLRAARPTGTDLWVVPRAGHSEAYGQAGREFESRVLGFFATAGRAGE